MDITSYCKRRPSSTSSFLSIFGIRSLPFATKTAILISLVNLSIGSSSSTITPSTTPLPLLSSSSQLRQSAVVVSSSPPSVPSHSNVPLNPRLTHNSPQSSAYSYVKPDLSSSSHTRNGVQSTVQMQDSKFLLPHSNPKPSLHPLAFPGTKSTPLFSVRSLNSSPISPSKHGISPAFHSKQMTTQSVSEAYENLHISSIRSTQSLSNKQRSLHSSLQPAYDTENTIPINDNSESFPMSSESFTSSTTMLRDTPISAHESAFTTKPHSLRPHNPFTLQSLSARLHTSKTPQNHGPVSLPHCSFQTFSTKSYIDKSISQTTISTSHHSKTSELDLSGIKPQPPDAEGERQVDKVQRRLIDNIEERKFMSTGEKEGRATVTNGNVGNRERKNEISKHVNKITDLIINRLDSSKTFLPQGTSRFLKSLQVSPSISPSDSYFVLTSKLQAKNEGGAIEASNLGEESELQPGGVVTGNEFMKEKSVPEIIEKEKEYLKFEDEADTRAEDKTYIDAIKSWEEGFENMDGKLMIKSPFDPVSRDVVYVRYQDDKKRLLREMQFRSRGPPKPTNSNNDSSGNQSNNPDLSRKKTEVLREDSTNNSLPHHPETKGGGKGEQGEVSENRGVNGDNTQRKTEQWGSRAIVGNKSRGNSRRDSEDGKHNENEGIKGKIYNGKRNSRYTDKRSNLEGRKKARIEDNEDYTMRGFGKRKENIIKGDRNCKPISGVNEDAGYEGKIREVRENEDEKGEHRHKVNERLLVRTVECRERPEEEIVRDSGTSERYDSLNLSSLEDNTSSDGDHMSKVLSGKDGGPASPRSLHNIGVVGRVAGFIDVDEMMVNSQRSQEQDYLGEEDQSTEENGDGRLDEEEKKQAPMADERSAGKTEKKHKEDAGIREDHKAKIIENISLMAGENESNLQLGKVTSLQKGDKVRENTRKSNFNEMSAEEVVAKSPSIMEGLDSNEDEGLEHKKRTERFLESNEEDYHPFRTIQSGDHQSFQTSTSGDHISFKARISGEMYPFRTSNSGFDSDEKDNYQQNFNDRRKTEGNTPRKSDKFKGQHSNWTEGNRLEREVQEENIKGTNTFNDKMINNESIQRGNSQRKSITLINQGYEEEESGSEKDTRERRKKNVNNGEDKKSPKRETDGGKHIKRYRRVNTAIERELGDNNASVRETVKPEVGEIKHRKKEKGKKAAGRLIGRAEKIANLIGKREKNRHGMTPSRAPEKKNTKLREIAVHFSGDTRKKRLEERGRDARGRKIETGDWRRGRIGQDKNKDDNDKQAEGRNDKTESSKGEAEPGKERKWKVRTIAVEGMKDQINITRKATNMLVLERPENEEILRDSSEEKYIRNTTYLAPRTFHTFRTHEHPQRSSRRRREKLSVLSSISLSKLTAIITPIKTTSIPYIAKNGNDTNVSGGDLEHNSRTPYHPNKTNLEVGSTISKIFTTNATSTATSTTANLPNITVMLKNTIIPDVPDRDLRNDMRIPYQVKDEKQYSRKPTRGQHLESTPLQHPNPAKYSNVSVSLPVQYPDTSQYPQYSSSPPLHYLSTSQNPSRTRSPPLHYLDPTDNPGITRYPPQHHLHPSHFPGVLGPPQLQYHGTSHFPEISGFHPLHYRYPGITRSPSLQSLGPSHYSGFSGSPPLQYPDTSLHSDISGEPDYHYLPPGFGASDDGEGCSCWHTHDDGLNMEVECRCQGKDVMQIPDNLTPNMDRLTLTKVKMHHLASHNLSLYSSTLKELVLRDAANLKTVEADIFTNMSQLQTIYLSHAPSLVTLPANIFSATLPHLKVLRVVHTGLRQLPDLTHLDSPGIIQLLDLENNKIKTIRSQSINVSAHQILLDNNALERVEARAFQGSQIGNLSMRGNPTLTYLDPLAFQGIKSLRALDLSETSINFLPTKGLENLETLSLHATYKLKVFPSVYSFKHITEAHLTYPYHCCAFRFPKLHHPDEHSRHEEMMRRQQESTFCSDVTSPSPSPSPFKDVLTFRRRRRQISPQSDIISFQDRPTSLLESRRWGDGKKKRRMIETKNYFGSSYPIPPIDKSFLHPSIRLKQNLMKKSYDLFSGKIHSDTRGEEILHVVKTHINNGARSQNEGYRNTVRVRKEWEGEGERINSGYKTREDQEYEIRQQSSQEQKQSDNLYVRHERATKIIDNPGKTKEILYFADGGDLKPRGTVKPITFQDHFTKGHGEQDSRRDGNLNINPTADFPPQEVQGLPEKGYRSPMDEKSPDKSYTSDYKDSQDVYYHHHAYPKGPSFPAAGGFGNIDYDYDNGFGIDFHDPFGDENNDIYYRDECVNGVCPPNLRETIPISDVNYPELHGGYGGGGFGDVLETVGDGGGQGVASRGNFMTAEANVTNRHVLICQGKLSKNYRDVKCYPEPDAFNPCEDIMGNLGLRVAVWFVVVTAVFGNLAVLIVLMRFKMTVSKFLMCNLAVADLSMGLYLLIIAAMDLHTIGVYFNYAIDWQNGPGCQVAGFLTVFSSELSILTLTVITLERWYAITYAIHLNKRLRLPVAVKVMVLAWLYSLTMATLPLVGVSAYSRTSICLPMDTVDRGDQAYLLILLITNGLAFLLICVCYAKMYCSIASNHLAANTSDTTVAKRMALLVFTDFACWAPIAFFGLTAVSGYPLISVTHAKFLLVFFYPLNSCANPYLYAILTKQYRRDLFIMLARHGFFTKRAMKYKGGYSTNTGPNQHNICISGTGTGGGTSGGPGRRISTLTQITTCGDWRGRARDASEESLGPPSPFGIRSISAEITVPVISNRRLLPVSELHNVSNVTEISTKPNFVFPNNSGSPHPIKNCYAKMSFTPEQEEMLLRYAADRHPSVTPTRRRPLNSNEDPIPPELDEEGVPLSTYTPTTPDTLTTPISPQLDQSV